MQHHVDIAEVQAHLVELLKAATPGDEILITQNGEEVGKLLPLAGASVRPASLSPQEKARLWREWAASHSHDTPLLSDEAISRESIYGERG